MNASVETERTLVTVSMATQRTSQSLEESGRLIATLRHQLEKAQENLEEKTGALNQVLQANKQVTFSVRKSVDEIGNALEVCKRSLQLSEDRNNQLLKEIDDLKEKAAQERTSSTNRVVALSDEKERIMGNQFKLIAFIGKLEDIFKMERDVAAGGIEELISDSRLHRIYSHIKDLQQRWDRDGNLFEEFQNLVRRVHNSDSAGASSQPNASQNAQLPTPLPSPTAPTDSGSTPLLCRVPLSASKTVKVGNYLTPKLTQNAAVTLEESSSDSSDSKSTQRPCNHSRKRKHSSHSLMSVTPKFKCKHCDHKPFRTFRSLKTHMKHCHNFPGALSEFREGCKFCGQVFRTKKDYKIHKTESNCIPGSPLTCESDSPPRSPQFSPSSPQFSPSSPPKRKHEESAAPAVLRIIRSIK